MWKEKFIKYLRNEKNYSSHTEISYLRDLRQFEGFVKEKTGSFNPIDIDSDIIREWIASLVEQGLKASSTNRKLSTIKSFFVFLQKKEIVKVNPATYIRGPKKKHNLPSFVNHSDMVKILRSDRFNNTFEDQRNRFLIELIYLTGMRQEEVMSLKDENVNLVLKAITVHGKGNKERVIPFSEKTAQRFHEYFKIRDIEVEERISPYVFVRKNGKQLYPAMIYTIVNTHLSEIKTLSKRSPHVLRHSFATVMLNNGAEINAIKKILGHSSLASTQIYTHVTFKELKEIYDNAHPRA